MSVSVTALPILEHHSLQPYNTFGIEARARCFVEVNSVDALREALEEAKQRSLPVLILGGGSNILPIGDISAFVIRITLLGVRIQEEAAGDDTLRVTAMAGEVWHELVAFCLQQGCHGLENLALIPGTVGAAPVQNIGAYGVELKDVFVELQALHRDTGELLTLDAGQCRFAYRDSVFKQALKDQVVILSVTFRLSRQPIVQVGYGALQNALAEQGEAATPQAVFDAVCAIRRAKLPDPGVLGNAGSFFKNPVIPAETYRQLLKDYPALPSFSTGDPGTQKVPAAWLIEQAGWKGKRLGNAGVHAQQPLVLVNYGGVTGRDILTLADAVHDAVLTRFGIDLEREVQVVGELPT